MNVPFNNFKREYELLKSEIDDAVRGVMERGYFILGPEVEKFEKAFAAYDRAEVGIGVNSGTDALYLSMLAAGIGEGDEVIIPVNTALATAMAVEMSGAKPIFVDCDDSFLIDIDAAEAAVTPKTRAIIPVHLYGQSCDMDRVMAFAHKYKLLVVEDCAQAAGAEWKGRKVGNFGDLAAFSFYPTKTLGAYGDGGMILTNNLDYFKEITALRFYGTDDRGGRARRFGVNSRLDEMQAAILNVKLKYLDERNERRRAIAQRYGELLKDADCTLPLITDIPGHVYHLFVIRTKKRDELRAKLQEDGIDTLIHYPYLLHQHPFFNEWVGRSFPRAEVANKEILSLPLNPLLTDEEVEHVATAICDHV